MGIKLEIKNIGMKILRILREEIILESTDFTELEKSFICAHSGTDNFLGEEK